MLSLYLGDACARDDAAAATRIEAGRLSLAARVPAERMQRICGEGGGNVEVAVLGDLVGNARSWLYAGDRA
jgi:hypothetical protein